LEGKFEHTFRGLALVLADLVLVVDEGKAVEKKKQQQQQQQITRATLTMFSQQFGAILR